MCYKNDNNTNNDNGNFVDETQRQSGRQAKRSQTVWYTEEEQEEKKRDNRDNGKETIQKGRFGRDILHYLEQC